MQFTKMHGLGNDYIVINALREAIPRPDRLARIASDRRRGVGSDGLLLIAPSRRADFRMRMFNPDGSEAEMCGNGIRCLGKFVYEKKLTRRRTLTVETRAGIRTLRLHGSDGRIDRVTADMGPLQPVPRDFHRQADGNARIVRVRVRARDRTWRAWVLSVGNPHCIIRVPNVRRFPVDLYGPVIEHHPDFPSRTNVEFITPLGPRRILQRTWERGVGETSACGTGATAVAASQFLERKLKGRIRIDLPGGSLVFEMRDDRVFMTGPASTVCDGVLSPEIFRRSRS